MIKKKVTSKVRNKSKFKSKVKAKKVSKKVLKKIKNPVYLTFYDKLKKLFINYSDLNLLSDNFVNIYSNTGIIYGMLISKKSYQFYSFNELYSFDEKILEYLGNQVFTLKTNFNQMPNRDDLSLIAENNDYLGNELFWNEYDGFKKDSFKKSTDFQFILGNVDKVDVENNRIYVRRLKQVKSKND